jgi:hypothetical protein
MGNDIPLSDPARIPGVRSLTDEEVRQDWLRFWRKTDQAYRDAKDSPGALPALFERYSRLGAHDRAIVDAVLGERLEADDETTRFDVLALVDEFSIQKALPQLQRLAGRLSRDASPSAPFELRKVRRIADRLSSGR